MQTQSLSAIIVGTRAAPQVRALQAAGFRFVAVADNNWGLASQAGQFLGVRAFGGETGPRDLLGVVDARQVQLVVVDELHASPEVLGLVNWGPVVLLEDPTPSAIRQAQRGALRFVVSNPLLFSVDAGGWRKLGDLVGAPLWAHVSCFVDWGEMVLGRGVLGQLTMIAWETLALPQVHGVSGLPARPDRDLVSVSLAFAGRHLQVTGQRVPGPSEITLRLGGPKGRVIIPFAADESAVPGPPTFDGQSGTADFGGADVLGARLSLSGTRWSQARYLAALARGSTQLIYDAGALGRYAALLEASASLRGWGA
jgi:hypothetical protein